MGTENVDIGILYNKGGLTQQEIHQFQQLCDDHGLVLAVQERGLYINASLELFVSFIQVVLSPENIIAIQTGLVTNGIYDVLKRILAYLRAKFFTQPVYKVRGGEVKEEPANIQFCIGENRLILPLGVDDGKFNNVLDRFFAASASCSPEELAITIYDPETDTLSRKTITEIAREEMEKQRKKSPDKTQGS